MAEHLRVHDKRTGVMVATHGDDKGLILPPRLAYIQIVMVPIYKKENMETIIAYGEKVSSVLNDDFRTKLDKRDGYSPGYKFSEWELRGIPLRIEVGRREAKGDKVTAVRRDTGEKIEVEFRKVI